MKPEEMKQALIDKHLDPWDKHNKEAFKAGYDYALSQALLKVDGDLVEKIQEGIRTIFCEDTKCPPIEKCPDNIYPACWDCWSLYFTNLLSPHLQAAADKEREIERLKGELADRYEITLNTLKFEVDRLNGKLSNIDKLVQQERERIAEYKSLLESAITVLEDIKNRHAKENSFHNNRISSDAEEMIKAIRQALEGKHE